MPVSPTGVTTNGERKLIFPTGKCIVGRGPSVDVGVNEGYRSVSRNHAILEVSPGGQVKFTDISPYGASLLRDQTE